MKLGVVEGAAGFVAPAPNEKAGAAVAFAGSGTAFSPSAGAAVGCAVGVGALKLKLGVVGAGAAAVLADTEEAGAEKLNIGAAPVPVDGFSGAVDGIGVLGFTREKLGVLVAAADASELGLEAPAEKLKSGAAVAAGAVSTGLAAVALPAENENVGWGAVTAGGTEASFSPNLLRSDPPPALS